MMVLDVGPQAGRCEGEQSLYQVKEAPWTGPRVPAVARAVRRNGRRKAVRVDMVEGV